MAETQNSMDGTEMDISKLNKVALNAIDDNDKSLWSEEQLVADAITNERPRWRILLACALILGMETCERLAYYGVNFTLVVYLTSELSFSNQVGSVDTNNWSGTCYLFPLLGAWLADSYMGRYWVILVFSFIYTLGLSGLAMSSSIKSLHTEPPADGEPVTAANLMSTGQLAFFWLSMYLIAIGTGGIKPCVSTFGADQFNMRNPRDAKMLSSFFVYFYCSVNVGALVSAIELINIQNEIGTYLVYIICACAFVVAISLYILGTPMYIHRKPSGSALTRAAIVMWRSFQNRRIPLPMDASELYEIEGPDNISTIVDQPKITHTAHMVILDRAALVVEGRTPITVTQIEEFKALLRFGPILLVSILWWMTYSMMSTLFILGGQQLDTNVSGTQISAGTMNSADIFAVLICAQLYEHVLLPLSVKFGHPVNLMWRIGFGYILSMFSMIAAALVEIHRMNIIAKDPAPYLADPSKQAPLSIMWQIPQYGLIGAAEVCTVVGMMELFYRECPPSVRSMASALLLLCSGLSSYFVTALQEIVQDVTAKGGKQGWISDNLNEAHLGDFYWVLAVINLVGFFLYIWIAIVFVAQGHANDAHRAAARKVIDDDIPEFGSKGYKELANHPEVADNLIDSSAANVLGARAR